MVNIHDPHPGAGGLHEELRPGNVGEAIVNARQGVYGEPVECFTRIAETWSGILGVHINPSDVPLCLIGLKLVRTQITPDYSDNSDDVEGYLDIFRQVVGEDMVHARSVTEYLELKEKRDNPLLSTKGAISSCTCVPGAHGGYTCPECR